MKRFSVAILSLFFVFTLIISCNNEAPVPTVGSLNGRVVYSSSNNNVTVSVEKSNGVSTDSRIFRSTKANTDGSYSFGDLEAGTYTVYASTDDSVQRAVCTNVNVEVGRSVTASDLVLTPIGSIKGKILIDGKPSGNIGCTVFIEGTSYKAVTADDGSFEITGIPSGKEYKLFVMKGETISLVNSSVKVPDASVANINAITIDSSVLSHGIIWKGSFESHPSNPSNYWAYYNTRTGSSYFFYDGAWNEFASKGDSIQWKGSCSMAPTNPELYWAYYNSTDGNSYIFNGTSWDILASKGEQGEQGVSGLDGKSIVWKGALDTPPESPQELWTYYNTTDGNVYIYNNNTWEYMIKNIPVNYDTPTIVGQIAESPFYSVADVNIKVVDDTSSVTVINDLPKSNGRFEITGLDSSHSYTLYFTTDRLPDFNISSRSLSENVTFGAVRIQVVPTAGSGQNIGSIALSRTGTIKGTVSLSGGESNYSGVDVFLDHTSFISKTNAEGEYVISGIPQGTYEICYMKNGFITESMQVIVYTVNPADSPIIEIPEVGILKGSCSINGIVGYSNREGSSGIHVTVSDSDGKVVNSSYIEKEGSFSFKGLKPGTYTITAKSEGYFSIEKGITVSLGDAITVNLGKLKSHYGSISGKVETNDQKSSEGTQILVINSDETTAYSTTVGEDGTYNIPSVFNGNYLLGAKKDGYEESSIIPIVLNPDEDIVCNVLLNSIYGSLKVSSSYNDKSDYSGILVEVFDGVTLIRSAYTDASGFVTLDNIPVGSNYEVRVSSNLYSSSELTDVAVNSAATTEIKLKQLSSNYGRISGVVYDGEKQPLEGANVQLSSEDGNEYTLITDSEGKYQLDTILCGNYQITVNKVGYDSFISSSRYTVNSNADTNPESIALHSQYGTINVYSSYNDKSDYSGILVELFNGMSLLKSSFSDSSGLVVFNNIPIGSGYRVISSAETYSSSEVSNLVVRSAAVTEVKTNQLSSNYGRISGVVYDGEGQPLEGANVQLSSEDGNEYTLITDSEGRYQLDTILCGNYQITVNKVGYDSFISSSRYTVNSNADTNPALITVMAKFASVTGHVSQQGSSDSNGIQIEVRDEKDAVVYSLITNRDGHFDFTCTTGTYSVIASKTGYFSSAYTLSVINGKTYEMEIEELVSQTGSVSGVVKKDNGEPINGALINLISIGTSESYSTVSVADGTYSFTDIPIGEYSISITKDGFIPAYASGVLVKSGKNTDVSLVELAFKTSGINGRVLLEGTDIFSGVKIRAVNSNDNSISYETTSESDGTYRLILVIPGEYYLSFEKEGFITNLIKKVVVSADVVLTLEDVLLKNEESIVLGKVMLSDSSLNSDISIILTSLDIPSLSYSAKTISDGSFRIENVKYGNYKIAISKEGYLSYEQNNYYVEKASTKNIGDITLNPAISRLSGKVTLSGKTDYAGVLIIATRINNDESITAVTNSEGVFSIENLPVGSYNITASKDKFSTYTYPVVAVTATSVINLPEVELEPSMGKIEGIVRREGYADHSGIMVKLVGTEYSAVSDTDGCYSMTVPTDTYTGGLRFEAENHGIKTYVERIVVSTNKSTAVPDMTISATIVPVVTGKVTLQGGSDHSGITVKILEHPEFNTITSSNGSWSFSNVPVGEATIVFEKESMKRVTKILNIAPAPSLTVEDIELIQDSATVYGYIKLNGYSDYSGVTVRISADGYSDLITKTSSSGYFSIGNVSASEEHRVTFEKEGWETQSFTLSIGELTPNTRVNITNAHPVTLSDITAPVIKNIIVTVGNRTENGREISLYINAADSGSGIKTVQANTSNSFSDITEYVYSRFCTVFIPDGEGKKTLYVRVNDGAGNSSNVVSQEIELLSVSSESVLSGPLTDDKLHLTVENSPYLITGNILVEKDKTLTIDPGVEVQVNGDYYIQVEGTLVAQGTEANRIKFYGVGEGANNWSAIKFLNDTESVLSYVDITGLKTGIYGYCDIDHAQITANGWAVGIGDYYYADDYLRGSLTDSTINGSVSVAYGDVQRNEIEGGTIYLYNALSVVDNTIKGYVRIENSYIDGNTFYGSELDTRYSFVYNNIVNSSSVYSYNDIQKYVTYNGCTLYLGYYSSSDSSMIPSGLYNIQFNNCSFPRFASDVKGSNFINCGPITVESGRTTRERYTCTENYWGDINTVEIKSKGDGQNLSFITDYYDDFNKSRIDYSKYKDSEVSNAGYQGDGFGRNGGSKVYNIGDTGPAGGLVFYDKGYYSDGWRYLEAAQTNIGRYVFGYYRPDETNNNMVGTAPVIGAGRYNTERLVELMDIEGKVYSSSSGESTAEYAAKKCLDYSYGGYDDWFLPSKDELNVMYNNLQDNGLGSFSTNTYYWSSFEDDGGNAWCQDFRSGSQYWVFGDRENSYYVRPVRAF